MLLPVCKPMFRCYSELLCCFSCSAVIPNCYAVSAVPLLFRTVVMFQLFRCYSELLCCFSCSAVIRNCCAVSAVPLLYRTAVLFLLFRCYSELLFCFCCSAVIRNCCAVCTVGTAGSGLHVSRPVTAASLKAATQLRSYIAT